MNDATRPDKPRPGHTGWALVTGLAVGFAIGQTVGQWRAPAEDRAPAKTTESVGAAGDTTAGPAGGPPVETTGSVGTTGGTDGDTESERTTTTSSPPDPGPPPGSGPRVYASMAEFPRGWLKDGDIPAGVLEGLTAAQTVSTLQAFNLRNCECGCSFGTLASCLKNDPECPRSPVLAAMVVGMARRNQPLASILATLDVAQDGMDRAKKSKPASHSHAAGAGSHHSHSARRRVELAAWNPRKGPPAAKVTVVEFSDFQ